MELDFASGSHESISDFRSRTSSAGSRDLPSSGFGSHDIRDRTGSTGSRDSLSRMHDFGGAHRPRTSTIGQDSLLPRTSSFGASDNMRPRALSHGNKLKDLSRRVKEKQLLRDSMLSKRLYQSSSRDSVQQQHKQQQQQSELSIIRSRSQEYGGGGGGANGGKSHQHHPTMLLPEDEYMTVNAPGSQSPSQQYVQQLQLGAGRAGGGMDGAASGYHSRVSAYNKHRPVVTMSTAATAGDAKHYFDPVSLSTRRASFRKDKNQGSSSESLSSSGSDKGLGAFKTTGGGGGKHASGRSSMKASVAALQAKKLAASGGGNEYMMASSPNSNSGAAAMSDDTYLMYEPGGSGCGASDGGAIISTFSAALEKVVSPIRDDVLSSFQIVSPIKEEDNDALFGPKPKTMDKETLDRLKGLKHEYVNVEFEAKKGASAGGGSESKEGQDESVSGQPTANSITDQSRHNVRDDVIKAAPVSATSTVSPTPVDNPTDTDDYMQIDFPSSSSGNTATATHNSSSGVSSDSNNATQFPTNLSEFDEPIYMDSSLSGESTTSSAAIKSPVHAQPQRPTVEHDYCEIDYSDVIGAITTTSDVTTAADTQQQQRKVFTTADPFAELIPLHISEESVCGGGSSQTPPPTPPAHDANTQHHHRIATSRQHQQPQQHQSSYQSMPNSSFNSVVNRAPGEREQQRRSTGGGANATKQSPPRLSAQSVNTPPPPPPPAPSSRSADSGGSSVTAPQPADGDGSEDVTTPDTIAVMDVFNIGAKPSGSSSTTTIKDLAAAAPVRLDTAAGVGAVCRVDSGKGAHSQLTNSRSATGSLCDQNRYASQSSVVAAVRTPSISNNLHSSSSSSALDALSRPVLGAGAAVSPRDACADVATSRHSYHESQTGDGANDSSSAAAQTGSVSSSSSQQQQLNSEGAADALTVNYARLDLSSSCSYGQLADAEEGSVCRQPVSPQLLSSYPSAVVVATTPSAGQTPPISYAEIDFDKCEQLKAAAAAQEKKSTEPLL